MDTFAVTAENLYATRKPFHTMSEAELVTLAEWEGLTDPEYLPVLIRSEFSSVHKALSGRSDIAGDAGLVRDCANRWVSYEKSVQHIIDLVCKHKGGFNSSAVLFLDGISSNATLVEVALRSERINCEAWLTSAHIFTGRAPAHAYEGIEEALSATAGIVEAGDVNRWVTSRNYGAFSADTIKFVVRALCASSNTKKEVVEELLTDELVEVQELVVRLASQKYLTEDIADKIVRRLALLTPSDRTEIEDAVSIITALNYWDRLTAQHLMLLLRECHDGLLNSVSVEFMSGNYDSLIDEVCALVSGTTVVEAQKLPKPWRKKIFAETVKAGREEGQFEWQS